MIWRRAPCGSGGGVEAWYTVRKIESMKEFNGNWCRNGAESMESLDSEQLVIGYANSRQSLIDAGMVLWGAIFFWIFFGLCVERVVGWLIFFLWR
jgi:hypothetical protein